MRVTIAVTALLLGAGLLPQSASARRPDALLSSPDAEVFGRAPSIVDPKLSPDGSRLLYLGPDASGLMVAYIRDLPTGTAASLLPAEVLEGHDIAWCEWASESRLLCLRVKQALERGTYADVFAINDDGTNPQHWLEVCVDPTGLRQGPLIDWLPEDPEHVMTICGSVARRLNIYTGETRDVPGATGGNILQAYLDGRGHTRVYDSGYAWYARIGEREDWTQVFEYRDSEFDVGLNYRPRLQFAGFGADQNEFYGFVETRGSSILMRASLAEPTSVTELLSFTTGSMPRALTLGKYDRIAAFMHYEHGEQVQIVDELVARIHDRVSQLLPGRDLVVVDESWDRRYYLILVDREQLTAEYVRYDTMSGTIESLGSVFELDATDRSTTVETVHFGDFWGEDLYARLTIPGAPAESLPAVILVPWIEPTQGSERFWPAHLDHRNLNQFLAARGYLAMEILDYIEMQGHPLLDLNFTADILDSARDYLVRRGLSTTGRICAVSWGPVAVASTIRYPDLFQCVIVIGQTIDPRRVDELLVALTPESPDTAPDIPIMMFVGDTNDRIGSFDISRLQRGRGKGLDQARDVDPIRYDDLDIFIRYGPSRIDMLTRIDQFLGEHIGR